MNSPAEVLDKPQTDQHYRWVIGLFNSSRSSSVREMRKSFPMELEWGPVPGAMLILRHDPVSAGMMRADSLRVEASK